MTACNDVQNNSLGKKAVSAALAGTLAVGMVPGVALAAVADDANNGIETLTASLAQEFANAKISQVQINGGATEATPSSIQIPEGTENAKVLPVQIASVTTGATINVLDSKGEVVDGLEVVYAGTGVTDPSKMPTAIGTYTVQVKGTANLADGTTPSPYAGVESATLSFSITAKSIAGATIFNNVDGKNNVANTTFTYNGGMQVLGVVFDGEVLPATDADTSQANYSIAYYNADGSGAAVGTDTSVAPTNAGTYRAVITGENKYTGQQQLTFTVGQLDLSTANITLEDKKTTGATAPYTTNLASINNLPAANVTAINGMLNFHYDEAATEKGSYEVTLSAAKDNATAAANITGTKTVSYNVVTNSGIYVTYNADNDQLTGDIDVNLASAAPVKVSDFKVYKGSSDTDATSANLLASSDYTITVTDQKGNVVDASSLGTAGKWNVTVAVDAASMDWTYGGTATATFSVVNGTIAASDIFVSYDGTTASSFSKPYSGQNYLPGIAVKVVSGDKTLVEGTDYKVAYTNSKNEEVTEFTNAGTYKVTVTSDTWTMPTSPDNVCVFTVAPIAVNASDLTVANQVTIGSKTGIAYTGNDITPVFQYEVTDADGKKSKVDLPASAYKISSITLNNKAVKTINAAGTYTVKLVDADADDNYTVTEGTVTVTVIDAKRFADVPADAWYAEVVDQAAMAGYMSGYAGTDLFGPNDKITRAQVACVLFNMSGGKVSGSEDNEFNENIGYTSFADVNPKAYYAQAVAWAKDAGVVNGFAGTDNFGPDQLVTREQFACMLWNYAKVNLSDTVKDVDVAAALASKPDGNKVSDWAKDGVAWAVQNKIMGNGGVIDPLTTVTRAETAAMVINYKPYVAVTGISINTPTVELSLAGATTATPIVTVIEVGGAATTWTASSDDTTVAKVDANGTITAVAEGTATITYASTVNPKVTATCEVTVTK